MTQISQALARVSLRQWFIQSQLTLNTAFASGSLSAGFINLAAVAAIHLARMTSMSRVPLLRSETKSA